jgi:hypothetical protein
MGRDSARHYLPTVESTGAAETDDAPLAAWRVPGRGGDRRRGCPLAAVAP